MLKFMRFTVMMMIVSIVVSFSSAQESSLEEQSFLLTFIPNIQFSPVYLAIADGYFADAGFDVSLDYLNEPDVLDLVAANQAQFGVVSGEQVILATSQGREVVFVYEWFQQYPIGVIVDANSTIIEPADLQNLRVGLPGRFGATYSGLISLLNASGLSEQDIMIEEIGFAAPEVFCLGVLSATTVYTNNEPIQIRNRAMQDDCGPIQDIRVLPVSDYVDLVSNGLITNQRMLTENPEKIRAFVGAYDAGLRAVINNPAYAYLQSETFVEGLPLSDDMRSLLQTLSAEQEIFLATNPTHIEIMESRMAMMATLEAQLPLDEITQFEVLLASIELWDADQLGYSDESSWANMQEVLLQLGSLEAPVNLLDIINNDFLPDSE